MSGPNDSGAGDTPTGDFKLTTWEAGVRRPLAPNFRLRLLWDTPRLEWRPTLAGPPAGDQPEFLRLDDPLAAVQATERYILSGSLLFDMKRPRFDLIDKAFVDAPTASPKLPSFAEMKAWEDDAFFRPVGRSAPLLGAPAPPPLLTPPLAPPTPSPYFKPPDPPPAGVDPAAPKAGSFGDVLKALHGLPIVQNNLNRLQDAGLRQLQLIRTDWDNAPWLDRITALTLSAPVAAGVLGALFEFDFSRHTAFNILKGMDVPAPFVPGLSFHVDDFGRADPYLLGGKADPRQPQQVMFGLKFDVLKAIPAVRKAF